MLLSHAASDTIFHRHVQRVVASSLAGFVWCPSGQVDSVSMDSVGRRWRCSVRAHLGKFSSRLLLGNTERSAFGSAPDETSRTVPKCALYLVQ